MRSGSTGTAEIVPVRSTWRRPVPRPRDRLAQVVAQIMGLTRRGAPPPGVAWRIAFRRVLCTVLALALWITWK